MWPTPLVWPGVRSWARETATKRPWPTCGLLWHSTPRRSARRRSPRRSTTARCWRRSWLRYRFPPDPEGDVAKFPHDAPADRVLRALAALGFAVMRTGNHVSLARTEPDG